MIKVEFFTHSFGPLAEQYIIEESDIKISDFTNDYFQLSDWDSIREAVMNIDDLNHNEWYIAELIRKYEDDGSGYRGVLWWDCIKVNQITDGDWLKTEHCTPPFNTELLISDDKKSTEDAIYLEHRHCMLKGVSPGAGTFCEGFATTGSTCEKGLILDTPKYWKYK